MSLKPKPPLPATSDELLIAALRHAAEVGQLLNEIGAELSRLGEQPPAQRRLGRLYSLAGERFHKRSGVALFIAAYNMGLELPADLRAAAPEFVA